MSENDRSHLPDGVAIIGMACRLREVETVQQLWEALNGGGPGDGLRAAVGRGSADEPAPHSLPGPDLFDAEFFGIGRAEAELLDPQHRVFLECAWEAMEDCGHDLTTADQHVGVFTSCIKGNDKDEPPNHVSYHLNLRGPSIAVQTGPSSSLVALATACKSLLSYECDVALVGGVSIQPRQGEAAGVVILRRLRDARKDRDHIRAVIRSAAVNNGGGRRPGYGAPSLDALTEVVALAQAIAGASPRSVGYVEASVEGTPASDLVELAALARVFGEGDGAEPWCAVGAVRSRLGNLGEAAGVVGLIKTVLALEHRQIPPSEGLVEAVAWRGTNKAFYSTAEMIPWAESPGGRRAGVSSFGLGGTNAHVILEEAPPPPPPASPGTGARVHLLTISAKSPERLRRLRRRIAEHLSTSACDLNDASYTLQAGRKHFEWRSSFVCTGEADFANSLAAWQENGRAVKASDWGGGRPVFLMPGLGTHYPGMARGLYDAEPFFAEQVDNCCQLLKEFIGADPRETLLRQGPTGEAESARRPELFDFARFAADPAPGGPDDDPAVAQPALFVVEYALARLMMHWGVRPSAMLGYSVGELVAACVAGVFTEEDALRFVAERAKLSETTPPGSMFAVPLGESEAVALTSEHVFLAATHGPQLSVLGGSVGAVARLRQELAEKGVVSRRLRVSRAFHTPLMRAIAIPLRDALSRARLSHPSIPFVSNLTGDWVRDEQAADPDYWVAQMCSPVRFAGGVDMIAATGRRLFLEVGPGRSLCGMVAAQLLTRGIEDAGLVSTLPSVYEDEESDHALMRAVGQLWENGADIDWERLHQRRNSRRISLPASPFLRQSCWLTPVGGDGNAGADAGPEIALEAEPAAYAPPGCEQGSTDNPRPPEARHATATDDRLAAIWSEKLAGAARVGPHDDFFDLGGDSLIAVQILTQVRSEFGVRVDLETFFRSPTVAALAAHIERLLAAENPEGD